MERRARAGRKGGARQARGAALRDLLQHVEGRLRVQHRADRDAKLPGQLEALLVGLVGQGFSD